MADLASVLVGSVIALGGQYLSQYFSGRNAVLSEQRKLGLQLLLWVEEYCDEIETRNGFINLTVPDSKTDRLVPLRDRIAAHSQALMDVRARDGMTNLCEVLGWIRNPSPFSPQEYIEPDRVFVGPIKLAARELLGAVQRGERVPTKLAGLAPHLKDIEDYHREAREYYGIRLPSDKK